MTVTVTGDGRGDGNSRTVSRFVSVLFAPTSYPSRNPKTPYRAAWRRCEHKCGVYLKLRRTTEQSNSNPVDMLFALFVFCSFLFGNVRSVFVLVISLKPRSCAESSSCSFCSAKKEIPSDLQDQSKNVVGGVLKCGQILYTWLFTSHNIYRSIRKGALFFISAPYRILVIDAHERYYHLL